MNKAMLENEEAVLKALNDASNEVASEQSRDDRLHEDCLRRGVRR